MVECVLNVRGTLGSIPRSKRKEQSHSFRASVLASKPCICWKLLHFCKLTLKRDQHGWPASPLHSEGQVKAFHLRVRFSPQTYMCDRLFRGWWGRRSLKNSNPRSPSAPGLCFPWGGAGKGGVGQVSEVCTVSCVALKQEGGAYSPLRCLLPRLFRTWQTGKVSLSKGPRIASGRVLAWYVQGPGFHSFPLKRKTSWIYRNVCCLRIMGGWRFFSPRHFALACW